MTYLDLSLQNGLRPAPLSLGRDWRRVGAILAGFFAAALLIAALAGRGDELPRPAAGQPDWHGNVARTVADV